MKYIKILFFVVWLTIVTLLTAVIGALGAAFTKGKSFNSCLQALEFWKVVSATFTGSKRQVKIFLKTAYSQKKHGDPALNIDIDAIDYEELFAYSLYSLYVGFYVWIIGGAILSAILYKAIYVSPVATVSNEIPKKDVIVYEKSEAEINQDLYCPCTPVEDVTHSGLRTIIVDQDHGGILISDNHVLTEDMISQAVIEKPFDFHINAKTYAVTYEDGEFHPRKYQGFVFSYDLNSLYFFDDKGFNRVALK